MDCRNDGFASESEEGKNDIDIVLQSFDLHYKDMTNILDERYLFLKRKQLLNETIE